MYIKENLLHLKDKGDRLILIIHVSDERKEKDDIWKP